MARFHVAAARFDAAEEDSVMLPSISAHFGTKPKVVVLEVRAPAAERTSAPVARLLIEREEQLVLADDGTLDRAIIRVWYDVIRPMRRLYEDRRKLCFEGSFTAGLNELNTEGVVSLTSTSPRHGAVFLDLDALAGHRIGTYLLNEIVCWAKRWPQAEVHPVQLLVGQATSKNKARRNRFYSQFGLRFDFEDTAERAGMSRAMTVADLTPVDSWRGNIRELSVETALREALETARAHELKQEALCADLARVKRERATSRALLRLAMVGYVVLVLAMMFAALLVCRPFSSN